MKKSDIIKQEFTHPHATDPEYVRLVSLISDLWKDAKAKVAIVVNTQLIDVNWQTGQYIVEFEQGGRAKSKYGNKLITNLAKDLIRLRGKGEAVGKL